MCTYIKIRYMDPKAFSVSFHQAPQSHLLLQSFCMDFTLGRRTLPAQGISNQSHKSTPGRRDIAKNVITFKLHNLFCTALLELRI